ncbi:subtilisin-like protein, partial [Neoconidiobolus thromboides FSU 785]
INGYSCSADKMNLEIIKNLKEVVSIEADTIVKLNRLQEDPPYHLSRLTSGRNFNSGDPYSYDSDGGSGVTAYIIDSGIDVNHNEFGGRAEWGTNMLRGTKDRDNVGHGTHVAGIIGSETYGVAKAVKLVAIKVFDPSANSANSDVIAAIDWVIHNHSRGPAIINLSLSSSYSTTLNSAVEGAIRRGINVVVAGGNSNADACDFSPSSARGAIVVGATTSTDARARYSNYGNCLSLFAPGDQILSTWPGQSTRKMSGTSMATPFVVGLSALLLSK